MALSAGIATAAPINASALNGAAPEAWTTGWTGSSVAALVPTAKPGDQALQFSGNSNKAAYLKLAERQDGGVLIDFSFQYSGKVDGNDFLGLWFGNSSNLDNAYLGPNIGFKANCGNTAVNSSCTNDLFVRLGGTEGYFINGSDLVENTTYRLFAHLYKSNGSSVYNSFDAWLNPSTAELVSLKTPDAQAKPTGSLKIASFDTIGIRTATIDKGLTVRIDNVNVREVPEPGTISLMGLALAGLAAFTRRKRA